MAKGSKTGGRKQGTPNILTREIRSVLKGIIAKELETLPATIEKFEPEKRLDIILKLLPYVLPRVNSVHMNEGEPLFWDV